MAFVTPVKSILKTGRTDSVKRVQFKSLSTNGLNSSYQGGHFSSKSQGNTRNHETMVHTAVTDPKISSSHLPNEDENSSAGFEGDEYEVEAIVGHKKCKGNYLYLLKWKGYSDAENTWEPADNLYCLDLLNEYKEKFNLTESRNVKKPSSGTTRNATNAGEPKPSKVRNKQKVTQQHPKGSGVQKPLTNGMSELPEALEVPEESAISEANRQQLSECQAPQSWGSALNSIHRVRKGPKQDRLKLIVQIDLAKLGQQDFLCRNSVSRRETVSKHETAHMLHHSIWCVSHDHTYFTARNDTRNHSINSVSTCRLGEVMHRLPSVISSQDMSVSTLPNISDSEDTCSNISITSGSTESCDLKLYLSPSSSSSLSESDLEICEVDDEGDKERLFQPNLSLCMHSHQPKVPLMDVASRWKGPMPLPRSFSKKHSSQSRLKTKAAKLHQKCRKCAVSHTRAMNNEDSGRNLKSIQSPIRVNGSNHSLSLSTKAQLPVIEINQMVSYKFANDYAYKELLMNWQYELNRQRGGTDNIILVENDVDRVPPPASFNYISSNLYRKGVPDPASPEMINSLCGCECYYLGRKCGPKSTYCCAHMAGSKFAYTNAGKVRVQPGTPIYECNVKCSCRLDCSNRIVQLGRRFPLCIFRTRGRGWGVKATQPIKSNTFVSEYVGEVITNDEAEKRGEKCDAEGITYLFDLDFEDDNSAFTIDAANYGNISHFFNHSCDPNLIVYSVWIDTLDKRLPRLAFFTTRNISTGEELTFDYQMSRNRDYSNGSGSRMRCLCGSKNCLGYID